MNHAQVQNSSCMRRRYLIILFLWKNHQNLKHDSVYVGSHGNTNFWVVWVCEFYLIDKGLTPVGPGEFHRVGGLIIGRRVGEKSRV